MTTARSLPSDGINWSGINNNPKCAIVSISYYCKYCIICGKTMAPLNTVENLPLTSVGLQLATLHVFV